MTTDKFGQILWVGSGKGGVGKSTVAVNIACALAAQGQRVNLIDSDLQGPSIARLMGLHALGPKCLIQQDSTQRIIPFFKYGVHSLSMANLMDPAACLTWRGPMMQKTLERLIFEVDWPQVDWTVIDLPPGTGDVPIALTQMLQPAVAIAVTTPQELAWQDTLRAINSWHELGTGLWGLVENMAGFEDNSHTFYLFGPSRLQEFGRRLADPELFSLPFCFSLREQEELGCPIAYANSQRAPWFSQIAIKLCHWLRAQSI